ncbi:hypothetical protein KHQ89_01980 [Mycoplasmatota bacterium]|nr:hypothetical protein KHQ89_01980 [Mycoplasmatota bacterium]
MKFLSYVLIVLYYTIFYFIQASLGQVQARGDLFIFVFFGFLPIALMFIERLKSPKQVIVKSLWYGIFIIISDFILRTMAVNQEQPYWSLIDDRYVGNQIRGYNIFQLGLDILKGLFIVLIWILIIVFIVFCVKLLIRLFQKYKLNIGQSIIFTVLTHLVLTVYMSLILDISVMEVLQSHVLFLIPLNGVLGALVNYAALFVLTTIVVYVKDNTVKINRVFHLASIFYLGYALFQILILMNPLFWALNIKLGIMIDSIVAFKYYFMTVIGIWFTIFAFGISRNDDDVAKEVIYVYKAIIVLIFFSYTIFNILI